MSAFVLLSLPLSLLVVAVLALLAFEDVAFHRMSLATPGMRLSDGDRKVAAEMVAMVGTLAGEGLSDERAFVCPETPFIPLVTEPEARAIAADTVSAGPAAVRRVLDRSHHANGVCPMRLNGGLCACATVRPLDCIGRCIAGADSPEWATGLGHSLSAAFRQHLETHHANAATRRLDEALVTLLDAPST